LSNLGFKRYVKEVLINSFGTQMVEVRQCRVMGDVIFLQFCFDKSRKISGSPWKIF